MLPFMFVKHFAGELQNLADRALIGTHSAITGSTSIWQAAAAPGSKLRGWSQG